MTLPRISMDTILATLDKAIQQKPDEFAMTTMLEGMIEQPELTAAIHEIVNKYVEPLVDHDEDDINPQAAAASMIELSACVYGIVMKAIKAQTDAEEMNEAWG